MYKISWRFLELLLTFDYSLAGFYVSNNEVFRCCSGLLATSISFSVFCQRWKIPVSLLYIHIYIKDVTVAVGEGNSKRPRLWKLKRYGKWDSGSSIAVHPAMTWSLNGSFIFEENFLAKLFDTLVGRVSAK